MDGNITKLGSRWPTMVQVGPKMAQVGPKMAQVKPNVGPSRPQVGPKMGQVGLLDGLWEALGGLFEARWGPLGSRCHLRPLSDPRKCRIHRNLRGGKALDINLACKEREARSVWIRSCMLIVAGSLQHFPSRDLTSLMSFRSR